MSYLVLARKYRPTTFAEVAGQSAAARTLENAIRLDRVAHAYLFAGPRGVGKTSMARILARALCCEKGPTPEPCGACERCASILRGNDLDVIEIDAASNRGIDDVRALREQARMAPMRGRTKLYIVDEAHQLTSEAFNALLKILEEPPAHVVFVLATTEAERLPDTIRSRCQAFEFRRVSEGEIAARLAEICRREGLEAEPAALESIARHARGGMRDAQSLLDQAITHGAGAVRRDDVLALTGSLSPEAMLDLLALALAGDASRLLDELAALDRAGAPVEGVLEALLDAARAVLRRAAGATGADDPKRVAHLAEGLDVDRALVLVNLLLGARRRVRDLDDPRLLLEATLLRVGRLGQALAIADALELVRGLGGPGPAAAAAPAPGRAPPRGPGPPRAERVTPAPGAAPRVPEAPRPAAPEDAVAASAAGSDLDGRWQALVQAVSARFGSIGAWLGGFRPVAFAGGVLEVAPTGAARGLYELRHPRVQKALQDTAPQCFGGRVEVREVAPPSRSGDAEDGEPRPPGAHDQAKEMFDGEFL